MKVCKKCGESKDESCFCKQKIRSDGLYPFCKDCMREYNKEYKAKNKDRLKEYSKQYRQNNPEYYEEQRKKECVKLKRIRDEEPELILARLLLNYKPSVNNAKKVVQYAHKCMVLMRQKM